MSLQGNRGRLILGTKELMANWNETKEHWRDARSAEFERQYLSELFDSVDAAGGVLEQLEKLLHKIKTDCE